MAAKIGICTRCKSHQFLRLGSLTCFKINFLCKMQRINQPTVTFGQRNTSDPPFALTSQAQVGGTRTAGGQHSLIGQIKGQEHV